MDHLQRPDKEEAGLAGAVWLHLEGLHLLVQLALLRDASAYHLGRNLRAQDEVVVAQVANAKDETEAAVAQRDNRILAEDDRLGAAAGPRQLGEDEADHEGLDKAADDRLYGGNDHCVGALGGGLPAAVADGVLGLQGEEEAGREAVDLQDAGRPAGFGLFGRQIF